MFNQTVPLYTAEESAIVADWLDAETVGYYDEFPDPWDAAKSLGFCGHASGYSEIDAAVASIVLERIQDRLPNWAAVQLAENEGEETVVAVAANRYFLTETMHAFAKATVAANISSDGMMKIAEFRSFTGLGRNQAIEVLEHFDRIGFTRRAGNARVVLKTVSEAFPQRP